MDKLVVMQGSQISQNIFHNTPNTPGAHRQYRGDKTIGTIFNQQIKSKYLYIAPFHDLCYNIAMYWLHCGYVDVHILA